MPPYKLASSSPRVPPILSVPQSEQVEHDPVLVEHMWFVSLRRNQQPPKEDTAGISRGFSIT